MTGPLIPSGPLTYGTELNAVYAIARVVAETFDTEAGLDTVFRLARTIFIFDVVALYLENEDSGEIEPTYARALGRGRSREAEIAWGEPAAFEAFRTGQTVLRREDAGPSVKGRERRRDYLGLPMIVGGRCVGGLIFGRFGGPSYPPEHIRLAEFVAWHVGQLLENRRMARRIASLEAQRELARMQDEFISTISHELRTPLGFIKGYVTTLLREDAEWEDDAKNEFLHIIDDESDRLCELIDNLLDSSRLESGTLSMTLASTRIEPIIRDVVARTRALYPYMPLNVEIAEDLPALHIDATRIAQVLNNLLSNANKYAPGTEVNIRVSRRRGQVHIEVADRGPGIPAEHIPNLFERFYRVPESVDDARGTGLGLFICRKLVEAHGGEIGVDSVPGEGARFFFTLPVPPSSAEREMERQNEQREDHPSS
ncbi:MAG: GAF domain-containing protein [Anaerolineaceae bacterium]|nr:MAG: GAF domain-containing protein [Anaerolineaceae bacterium]